MHIFPMTRLSIIIWYVFCLVYGHFHPQSHMLVNQSTSWSWFSGTLLVLALANIQPYHPFVHHYFLDDHTEWFPVQHHLVVFSCSPLSWLTARVVCSLIYDDPELDVLFALFHCRLKIDQYQMYISCTLHLRTQRLPATNAGAPAMPATATNIAPTALAAAVAMSSPRSDKKSSFPQLFHSLHWQLLLFQFQMPANTFPNFLAAPPATSTASSRNLAIPAPASRLMHQSKVFFKCVSVGCLDCLDCFDAFWLISDFGAIVIKCGWCLWGESPDANTISESADQLMTATKPPVMLVTGRALRRLASSCLL